jgi:hypothetical protein
MAAEESRRVDFRAWLVRVFPREPYIGKFFALLFWGYVGATYASYLLETREYGIAIVTLAFEPSGMRLTVADNGRGSWGNVRGLGGTGFGIPGLEERASALGGRVRASDAHGGGFVLEVELPTTPAGVA